MRAKVTASNLNVRNQPSTAGTIIGNVSRHTMLEVIADRGDWLEIRFDPTPAYVSADYVEKQDTDNVTSGVVTASRLHVRDQPGRPGKILGSLTKGDEVLIHGKQNGWYDIEYQAKHAYVYARYVKIEMPDKSAVVAAADHAATGVVADSADVDTLPLAPDEQYTSDGDRNSRKVASIWNRFGNLLSNLGGRYHIEAACAVAVLCVESSGDGFRADNQDRMVIRFENHKFWSFWGEEHPNDFDQHFKFNRTGKPWQGHQWRATSDQEWQDFHGDQSREWQVLEFARRLDDTAALKSISMGAPQIMGFNYAQLDYPSVQAMFEQFSKDIRYQIQGLFRFLNPSMISALRELDFVRFAGYYNGSGQKQEYGQRIDQYYRTYKNLAAS